MFWGLIMEPQRRYTQKVKKPFHISSAALDGLVDSEEPAQVMCGHGGRMYLLCTLSQKTLQCPLDLNFQAGSEISFATNGKANVHLTGYLIKGNDEELVEEEKEVSNKRLKRNKTNGPPSKKFKADELDFKSILLGTSMDEDDDSDHTFSIEDDVDSDLDGEDDSEEKEEDEEEAEEEEKDDDEEDDEEAVEDEEDENEDSSLSGDDNIFEPNSSKKSQTVEENGTAAKKKKKTAAVPAKDAQTGTAQKKETTLKGGVIIEDIKVGDGPLAKNGQLVSVYYEGRLKQNNKVFDSTSKGNGFRFRLGAGEVIKGWDVGVNGMKVGGKRRITCPPNMAYGPKGSPPAIPANATLVFEVELKKVR